VDRRTRTVVLAARHPERVTTTADELRRAGATDVEVVKFDAAATGAHAELVDDLFDRFGDFDVVLLAFGVLGDHGESATDAEAALEIARVNYLGIISLGIPLAARMRTQGHGTIVALSSAGSGRVRRSNFVYGSSKAGMDGFLQGLGDSLVDTGVKVMVVRPGYVQTKMTRGMKPVPFSSTADDVADAIIDGLARGSETVWVPPILRWVMVVLRILPRSVFRRLPM
jgi:decaprenylphospho-beta-D-erythro-pentofuranosid-2-ulose 2-reductase